MRKRLSLLIFVFILVATTALSGCEGSSEPASSDIGNADNGNKDTVTENKENKSDTDNQATTADEEPQFNQAKLFRLTGGWPKPPLYQGNPFGAGGVGSAWAFVFEGLFQFVRSTDKIYNRLAESIEHNGAETTVRIRPNVKWQDGQPFTSKDVWAYYTLNNGAEVVKYLESIETPDDSTVLFKWRQPAPFEEMKNLFLAQDWQATIAYHLYKPYVDKADELLKKAKKITDPNKEGPFGLDINENLRKQFDLNWQAFTKAGPKMPVGTGPFILKTVTASDMILEKNPNYWNAQNIKFEKVAIKNPGPDPAAGYALLRSGKVDIFDGTPPKDILDSILGANRDLVHYKMFDPATIGMVFNLDHKYFDNPKFRQAVVYALDRAKIREVGNYFGQEADVSMTGMPQSELDKWVSPELREKMTKFTYNPNKAEELLTELGWTKGSDGIWKDPDGKTPNFIIGVNGGWLPAVNSGQVAAEQLTKFGLPTKLMAVDGSVYYNNSTKDKGAYDMSVDWVDVSWGFMFPWNSMRNFYWWGLGNMAHLPRHKDGPDKGRLNLQLKGPDGQDFDVDKLLRNIPYMQNTEERKDAISKLAWASNEMAFGVGFFQNVTGMWGNAKTVKGWPMEDQKDKVNRAYPVPTDPNDIEMVAETNLGFAGLNIIAEGRIAPR